MERFVELRLLGNALLFLLPAEESYVDFMSINQKVCWGSHFAMLILTRLGTWRLCAKRARYSLRKQPKSSFNAKWPLRNERRNSLLMTRHYPDLGGAFDWLKQIFHAPRPIRSTAQIWVVTRHQYGISALQSLRGETSGDVAKCRLFQAEQDNVDFLSVSSSRN